MFMSGKETKKYLKKKGDLAIGLRGFGRRLLPWVLQSYAVILQFVTLNSKNTIKSTMHGNLFYDFMFF